MLITPELIDTALAASAAAPMIGLSTPAAPAAGGDAPMGPLGKAIIWGFIALLFLNGRMPENTQLALAIGIIVYIALSRSAGAGAHH